MSEFMNECIKEWMKGRMNKWMNDRMKGWVNEWMNEWMNERMKGWINECIILTVDNDWLELSMVERSSNG